MPPHLLSSIISATTRLVLGPLTTTFTPPQSCSSLFQPLGNNAVPSGGLPVVAIQGATCSAGKPTTVNIPGAPLTPTLPSTLPSEVHQAHTSEFLVDDADCWPKVAQNATTPPIDFLGWGLYSPGLLCPSGYTTACSTISTHAKSISVQSVCPNG